MRDLPQLVVNVASPHNDNHPARQLPLRSRYAAFQLVLSEVRHAGPAYTWPEHEVLRELSTSQPKGRVYRSVSGAHLRTNAYAKDAANYRR